MSPGPRLKNPDLENVLDFQGLDFVYISCRWEVISRILRGRFKQKIFRAFPCFGVVRTPKCVNLSFCQI